MKHAKIVSIVMMIAVFGSVAGVAWAITNIEALPATPPNQPPNSQMPKLDLPAEIRARTLAYVAEKHPEAAQFMGNLTWTGGAVQTLAPPATYVYNSEGWSVMIQEPPQTGSSYKVNAEYTQTGIGIPYHLVWEGTYQDTDITETNYNLAQ